VSRYWRKFCRHLAAESAEALACSAFVSGLTVLALAAVLSGVLTVNFGRYSEEAQVLGFNGIFERILASALEA
jgi:hypothetical protein